MYKLTLNCGVRSNDLVLFCFVFKEPQNKPDFPVLSHGISRSFQESTIYNNTPVRNSVCAHGPSSTSWDPALILTRQDCPPAAQMQPENPQ